MRLLVEFADRVARFSPADSPVEVGRQPGCAVCVAHPLVSRSHGRFRWEDGRWVYQDASRHGTLLCIGGGEAGSRFLRAEQTRLEAACELVLAGEGGARLGCRVEAAPAAADARRTYAEALAALARRDFSEALRGFLPLARGEPPVVEALRRAAECLEGLGRVREALPWAVRYGFLRPRDAGAWKLSGRLHAAAGDLEGARACLGRAAALDPADPEVGRLREQVAGAAPGAAALERATGEVHGRPVPHVLETRHFRIACDFAAHGRLLPDLAKALEVAAGRAAAYLGAPREKVPVALLARDPLPQEAPALGDRSAAAACAADGIRLYLPPGRARACHDAPYLAALALHEVVHALLLQTSDALPWWLHEGLAQTLSQGETPLGAPPAPATPPSLQDFETPPGAAEAQAGYAAAHAALVTLERAVGREGVGALAAALADGKTPAAALEGLGIPYPELSARAWACWRQASPPEAPHLITRDLIPERER